jgi:hypothetical protein
MSFSKSALLMLSLSPVFTACYAEIHEDPNTPHSTTVWGDSGDSDSSGKEPSMNRTCKKLSCSKLPVYVIYSLAQNLGKDNVVTIEAFTNSQFEGSPVASASITGFDATGTGSLSESELMLQPGKYYLRAFINNTNKVAAPYEYGGMKLISNRPVGFFGVASGAHSVIVEDNDSHSAPVTIKLGYLFKSSEKEDPTDANMRILFNVENGKVAESKRKLRIELRNSLDLAATPEAVYTLPSESLLVSGSLGSAEFVARNLPSGKYSVLAFVDSNNNEFLDEGELQQVYTTNEGTGYVNVQPRRTETIRLTLE